MTVFDRGTGPLAAGLVVVAAVAIVVSPTWWALVPTALVSSLAVRLQSDDTYRSTVIAAICWGAVGLFSVVSLGLVWPIPQLLGLAMAGALLRCTHWDLPDWLGPGRIDRPAWLLAVASIPITTMALVAFITSGRTDLDTATAGLQTLPTWTLPLVGIGFVLVNPTVEEILFRGVMQTMVTEVSRPSWGIAVQGIAFGVVHVNGVPGGLLGVAMAAGWGVVLGVVRHRTGSIRLVWVVHALANVAIYATVVLLAVEDGVI